MTEAIKPTDAPAAEPFSRRTLLIVDDEEGPREALRHIFENDYRVLVASDGYTALEIVGREPVDAAVLDICMAGMSGLETLERIKLMAPDVEVMLLTGFAALESAQDALRLGAAEYLSKPCDLVTLRSAVARLMERRIEAERRKASLAEAQALQRELEELRRREERLTAQTEIYSGVLHDINKPLTVIVGLTSLLTRQLRSTPVLEGQAMQAFSERLQAVAKQADNVTEVVQRYLSLLRQSRIETNRASSNRLLLDLRELLQAYPALNDRRVNFAFLSEDLEIRAHGTDVIQMLLNLALNALQASKPHASVHIGVQPFPNFAAVLKQTGVTPDRVLQASDFNPNGPVLAFRVADAGPGMPSEVLERLLEPRSPASETGRRRGLGLSFVKRLLLLNSGALLVQTAPGQGTTITLVLPQQPNGGASAATPAA